MDKNIILIPPCFTYGDILSIIGMVHYLMQHYDKVYLYIEDRSNMICRYYTHFFSKHTNFNKNIFIVANDQIYTILNHCEYGEYHICNTRTENWDKPNELFYGINTIDKQFYFNDMNPLYNKLKIDDKYICKPNTHLPNNNLEINHLFYYKLVGLNNNVRMDFFHYERDEEMELYYKNEILKIHNISNGDKYNIINSSGLTVEINIFKKHIKNDYACIDIHNLVEFPGWLLLLIENAETVNLVEGSNVNFIYHCQYKNIIKITSPVYFYIWLRDRKWEQYNLDKASTMMTTPILENWKFLYEDL